MEDITAARTLVAFVGAIAALYLVNSWRVLARMYAPSQSHIMTATQEVPQSVSGRFWYVLKMPQVRRAPVSRPDATASPS